MSEYIKREQVLKLLESAQAWNWSMNTLHGEIQALPAEDVVPVVHGRWEGWTTPAFYGLDDFGEPIYRDATFYRCSICSRKSAIKEKFCPSCGAKMDLEED